MSPFLEQLKATLRGLSAAERAELAHYLLHTCEPAEEEVAAEWLALAQRRMAGARAGRVIGIRADEVLGQASAGPADGR